MGQRRASGIALGLALCAASALRAAEPLHFGHLTVDDGLSQSWVSTIVKDRRGFLWFGTPNGLNRYDGTGFRLYNHRADDPAGLSAASVNRLLEDSRGRLWVGTSLGLDRYDPEHDNFEHVKLVDAPNGDSVRGLAEGRSGQLWIATENGLVELDPERRSSTRTLGDPGDPSRLTTNVLLDVMVDRQGIVWASAASGGVNRFDPQTRKVTRFPFPAAVPGGTISAEVHRLYQDEHGAIWVSVLGGGLGRIDPETNRVTRYLSDPGNPHGLSTDRVRCVLGNGHGQIYVGTENGGLDVLDVASGDFRHSRPDLEDADALNSGSIYALLLDDQGILWLGTYNGGVNYALQSARRFELLRAGRASGLSDPHVAAVVEDRHGEVWIGTDGGGLDRWQRSTGRITVLRHDPRDSGSLPTDAVLALLEDSRGDLWVAGWAGGLSRLDRRTGRFTRFGAYPPGLFDHVFTIIEDGPEDLVLGTLGGAAVFNRRTHELKALAGVPAVQPPLVQALLRDAAGNLWLGHAEGVDRLDRRTGRLTRYRPDPRDPATLAAGNCQALHQDSRGNVWIGTLRGLHVVPRAGGALRRYSSADGLPGDVIKAILEDEAGNLWVSTDRGLSRISDALSLPEHPQILNFNRLDGLQGNEFRYGTAFRSRSGEMFFGGNGGLSAFVPRDVQLNLVPPPVAFTDLTLSGRSRETGPAGPLLARSLAAGELRLSYQQDFVVFSFAALNFILPEKNQYAYRMEGLDAGWRTAGNAHTATYTRLPPGRYVFRVRAANNDGVWNEKGASLRIVVTPPFWATWWFRLAALALCAAALTAGYAVRVRSLERRERELSQRVLERTAELQTEIGERKRAEAALRESEERYALAVRGTADGIWDWDLKAERIYYSPRWKAILGYGGAEIGDTPGEWFDRVHPEDIARLQAKLAAHRVGPLAQCEDEHRIRHKDGDFRRVLCRAFAVHDESGTCVRVVGVITDVTDRRAFDPLTGLPTRNLFLQHLDEALARGRQSAAARVAVFVLDLDRFKMVNDSFGHVVGDKFLIEVANRITACLRPSDLVARFAGDQFALMVSGVSETGDAVRVMERIQHAFKAPLALAGTEVFASLTVGIALGTPDYERGEDLLRDGDTALHRAKASSGRRYEIFEPGMRLQVMERLRVEGELRRALERDELHLHYQPILSLASGQVEGFEGLVRWHHPERGLIMPDKFIRIAEETGLISALGRLVMGQACRQLREWLVDAELPLPVWISVNVSAKEFLDPEFVSGVRALVVENQIPRGALRVEITETTLLEGDQFVRANLERLRELGVGIDIDDFGTGYSSLSYLQQLPIDTLKIDRVFVKRLAGPAADPSIVRAILDMAKSLGLSVVAEGVETRQQLERLAHLGCQKAQGYYISAAVEPQDARALIRPRRGEPSRLV
jgi:diguanylate cyclase (GGDEF)-like protein/PAS domain S-box-containing protein